MVGIVTYLESTSS